MWVKQGINAWMTVAGIEDGRLLRSVSKSGKVNRDTLSDWAVWSVVEQSSQQIGAALFIGLPHRASSQLRNQKSHSQAGGRITRAEYLPVTLARVA
jgi:hypothetical protein